MEKVMEKINVATVQTELAKAGLEDYTVMYKENDLLYIYINNFKRGYAGLSIVKNEELVGDTFCHNLSEIDLDNEDFDFYDLSETEQIKYLSQFII